MIPKGTPFKIRVKHLRNYALGILIECSYVVSMMLVALILLWLVFRWF